MRVKTGKTATIQKNIARAKKVKDHNINAKYKLKRTIIVLTIDKT